MSELPESWLPCRFDTVARVISGRNQKEVESPDGIYPIYGSGGTFGRATSFLCEPGTTVIGRKGTINSPIFVNERFWNVDTAFGLFPISCAALLPRILFYFCRLFDFAALDKSTTIPSLAKRDIEAITIPLPPLAEQRRIVAKIEELFSELDAGEESLRQARRQLGVYRQSLLKQAFEGKLTEQWRKQNPHLLESPDVEPVESDEILPAGWRTIKLGSSIENPIYGTSKKCSYESEGLGVLRIPNVVNGAIDAADLKFAKFTKAEIASYELKAGDLLLIRSNGSVSIVGRCALIEEKHTGFLYAGYLIRLRPIKSLIDPLFLRIQLGSLKLRSQIEFSAKSTSGVNNINAKEIQRLVIALPSLPEQQEIVRLLDEQFTVIAQNERELDTALKRSEALRQSILKKAFTGQLVPPACRQAGKIPEEFPQPESGKWWVYVLKCEDGSFYKGFTNDLPERWKCHVSGKGAKWTAQHPPVELLYWEEHWSEASAVERERFLKSGSGREWFKREIVDKPHEYEPASALLERIRAERESAKSLTKANKKTGRKRPVKP